MNAAQLPAIDQLLFYKTFQNHPVIQRFQSLIMPFKRDDQTSNDEDSSEKIYYDLKSEILSAAVDCHSTSFYADTPWKNFVLSKIIADENPLSLLMEKEMIPEAHPFYDQFCREIEILVQIYDFDWETFLKDSGLDHDCILSAPIFRLKFEGATVYETFSDESSQKILKNLNTYLMKKGLGSFEKSRCFKINGQTSQLIPISNRQYKKMEDLVGYELQKQALLNNTAAFVKQYGGLNILLQGDMGTGKSTMVKALLNRFSDSRLRMIELKRAQIPLLSDLIHQIADRPYSFIIFIDDLSFDENDDDFMLFKNSLEGSLEDNPKNVRIYATSNKRHLITETRSERDDAIHARDILQEKLSLTARFGLVLNFSAPNQGDYLEIVRHLAESAGLEIDAAELESKALTWEKRHLNRSGRTAEQFIEYLAMQKC